MKPSAYVDFKLGDILMRAVLMGTDHWETPDYPHSEIPSYLDRVTLSGQWSAADGDMPTFAASLASHLLGGKPTIVHQPRTPRGAVN
jgi:hypothetical protein